MIKEELLQKLTDIEWDDFEVKQAQDKLPENVWETVSAFSNTSGGWIVFGILQHGKKFEITGCNNAEKTESDFLNTLRNGQKFNFKLSATGKKFTIDGKKVLAFYVPSSPFKPIYFGSTANTFIRTGSGDRRATDFEVMAIMRDQAFGSRSEQPVDDTSLKDLNPGSLNTYRNHIRNFNPSFPYLSLDDDQFCKKVGITASDGRLTIGGMLMFGSRDVVQGHISNFWIDFMEIPGRSYQEASIRYTYRMQEQDNIWESFQIILQRLRNYCDNPYNALPTGEGPEDESQLYALREGLVNLCAHADFFSPMHPTIRAYSDRIEFQNPGRFMFPLEELRTQIHSMPRNPNIIKFFRYAKLGENAGYGIDKMLTWEKLTGKSVEFKSDIVCSTITYYLSDSVSGNVSGNVGGDVGGNVGGNVLRLINSLRDNVMSVSEMQKKLQISSLRYFREKFLYPAIEQGYVLRSFPDKPKHPKQRYYLSEKGLKNITKA